MAERRKEIYRDIVPGLADLARRTGKTLKVKLHPSENLKERQRLVATTLSGDQSRSIQWLTGNMEPELLRRMYFGVTVQSSVVVECLIHGVPCFLCEWLDLWPYGYLGQFRKFGVGMGLRSPAQIESIPDILARYRPDKKTTESCRETIMPQRLEQLLAGRRDEASVPLGRQRAQ